MCIMFNLCVELREIPRPARLLDLEPRRLNRNKLPPGFPARSHFVAGLSRIPDTEYRDE